MKIDGHTIILDGNELSAAIDAYLVAHDVSVSGARTIRFIDGARAVIASSVVAQVYVDPSGQLRVNEKLSPPRQR